MTTTGPGLVLHKGRSEALADGVFAIALTLLVLELKVPDGDIGHLGQEIVHHRAAFLGYTITFAIGGLFWYLHHATFQFLAHVTPRIAVANLAFLGCVSVLPFTMACFCRGPESPLPVQLYLGNFLAIALLLCAIWRLAQRHGAFAPEAPPQQLAALQRRIHALPVAAALGFATSFVRPEAAMYAFVVVVLFTRLRARLRRAGAAPSTGA